MPTYFPCDPGAETSPSSSTLCIKCVLDQNPNNACTSSGSSNSSSNESSCDVYCNSGCNTKCTDSYSQTVCGSGHQSMSQHPDVGSYPGGEISKDDIIYEKWTAEFFKNLNSNLTKAESIGAISSQGSSGSFANPSTGDVITANFYNSVEQKLSGFGSSYQQVSKNDIITAAIANAIGTAYNAAQFKTSVCDVCNSSQHIGGTCGCNCSCACACNCGCSCTCPCPCSCQCNFPCSCPANS